MIFQSPKNRLQRNADQARQLAELYEAAAERRDISESDCHSHAALAAIQRAAEADYLRQAEVASDATPDSFLNHIGGRWD